MSDGPEVGDTAVDPDAGPDGAATYADAGVDIDAGNEVVERIGKLVQSTYTDEVLPGSHGGFAGLFRLFGGRLCGKLDDPVLVGATDGVGTKLKVAFLTGRLHTVGIDLVAMCVNDLIVGGARPLFFLDYIATGAVEPEAVEEIVKGIVEGCLQADCALLGGETAEMPGFYQVGEFDLAGFSVGVVDRKKIIDGRRIKKGNIIVGLPSSGVHSNGFSLVRRVLIEDDGGSGLAVHVPELGRTLGEELLEPTRIYVRAVHDLLDRFEGKRPLRGLAHITGGGLVENIPRVLPEGTSAAIDRSTWTVPPIFDIIQQAGSIADREMERVFNLGVGMVFVVSKSKVEKVLATLEKSGEQPFVMGEIIAGDREVIFR